MPWIRAKLRDKYVYARATPEGTLLQEEGLVEVRFRPSDTRTYRARASNLTITDAEPLADSGFSSAEAVPVSAARTARTPENAKKINPSKSTKKPGKGAIYQNRFSSPPDAHKAIAYTDGACSGNPGPAGLGVVLIDGERAVEISEYLGIGTNNIAELTAILRALESIPDKERPMVIHTDSQYAIGVLAKGWKAKANQELIARIRAELRQHPHASLVYVPGHSGVPLNERADELARQAVLLRKSHSGDVAVKSLLAIANTFAPLR